MLRVRIKDVLVAAKVDIDERQDIMDIWEGWLDYSPSSSWDGNTIEDSAPLSESVFKAIGNLLTSMWTLPISPLEHKVGSLRQVEAVKATTWLCHVMEMHVHAEKSFTELLLLYSSEPYLLEALYHHLGMLPQIQDAVNQYSQSFMKSFDAKTSRFDHFQQTQIATQRLQTEVDNHIIRLEHVIGEFYSAGLVSARIQCRRHLGHFWYSFIRSTEGKSSGVHENTSATGLDMTLRILFRVLQGASSPLQPSYRHLLFYILLPLHRPSSMVLWRDQTPILDLYHEPLVQSIAFLLKEQPEWKSPTISALIASDIWPHAKGGSNGSNTPKIVLLLHEINTILTLPGDIDDHTWDAFIARLVLCMASDNSRLAEQALLFFRNESFNVLFRSHLLSSLPTVLRAIVKKDLPWNPTVRKMTYHVLKDLLDENGTAFAAACRIAFTDGGMSTVKAVPLSSCPGSAFKPSKEEKYAPDFSLKAAMGDWKPPMHSQNQRPVKHSMLPPPKRPPKSKDPPSSITGIAPWARSHTGNPPLTVTGVAPWTLEGVRSTKTSSPVIPHLAPIGDDFDDENSETQALSKVISYMNQIKPVEDESDGTSSWAKTQMAESPTLLPSLKFHDLVFGHELGSGAFGTVKYARVIDKTTTRSSWPEYAVKIISTTKIVELGYEHSVRREIAVLRVLSHPGIARLVSSFRFKDGAYLVLEYASRGDLHTLLQTSGSLDSESTKFVMGEVIAALSSIHELGFVYGDLKPENVLITETGHIKITDFGACRPVTNAAKNAIGGRTVNIINELRDGDWKSKKTKEDLMTTEKTIITGWSGPSNEDSFEITSGDGNEEDDRIEGTTAYLPPEVVMGAAPTTAADVWAFGCLLYQCLAGRLPLLEDDEDATKQKIVQFAHSAEDQQDHLFSSIQAKNIAPKARELIRRILTQNLVDRPSLNQVADDNFFEGTNVFALYRGQAYPLNIGAVQPKAEAKWTRRQFSSIWAPQPKCYDIALPDSDEPSSLKNTKTDIIAEGQEGSSFFSITSDTTISEN